MRPIGLEDIKEPTSYDRVRAEIRKRVIELRNLRRIQVGERVSIVFENRETVLYQLHEMLRTERITEEAAILREIDTYNEMLAGPGSLAGTLFIELDEPARIRESLEQFVGLDHGEHVWFDLGDAGLVHARFAEGQGEKGKITSVHYVRFPFSEEAINAFRNPAHPVHLVVDQPGYHGAADVGGATRVALAEDIVEE